MEKEILDVREFLLNYEVDDWKEFLANIENRRNTGMQKVVEFIEFIIKKHEDYLEGGITP